MNNCTLNFTIPETSTFSTAQSTGLLKILDYSLLSFNFLFGLPLHSYVLWLIVTGTGSGVASEFFILNLSVCEAANCLNILAEILDQWLNVDALRYFLLGPVTTGRPLFQCLICVERYLAVVHPVTFLKSKPLRYRLICCSSAWIITLTSCFCCMLTIVSCNLYIYEWFFSVQFLLFFSIQLFCLMAVLRALKQSGPGDRRKAREEENPMKRRAFNLILISTASMAIIYVPFAVSGFSFIVTHQYIQEPFTIAFLCYILAGFVQPFLYLKRVGKLSVKNNIKLFHF